MNPDGPRTGRPSTFAPRGMVATPHYLASEAGLAILRRGGSAVDAAIAANAVLGVAYPHMAGIGGDGFWLIHGPTKGRVEAISAAGPAARLATREHYRERGHEESIPRRGAMAALTVPGAVDGWRLAHEAYGKLAWDALFEDAIRYARGGLGVAQSLAQWIAKDEALLRADPIASQRYLHAGAALREGARLVQPELAASLGRIARDGARAGFYEGETARILCDALAPEGCPLRTQDLQRYRAEWVAPISTSYRGREVYEFAPPTQGFATLQILNLIEGYDVRAWGDGSADYYHHLAEAVKVSFADRDEWLTDPRFVDIPLERLLSKEYASERRRLIRREGSLGIEGVEPGIAFATKARRATPAGDTAALQAVDSDGLVVSAIQSIYFDFGAGITGGGTGVLMQNRGAFFSLDERHVNRLEPGKLTFHTLTPGLVLRDGRVELAFGAMGGEGQPQTHVALLTRLVDFGYGVQQAIEAPRWLLGRTWGEKTRALSLEGRVADAVAQELARRGQPVRMAQDFDENMGHAQAIRLHAGSGLLEGGADPRGDGAASGW